MKSQRSDLCTILWFTGQVKGRRADSHVCSRAFEPLPVNNRKVRSQPSPPNTGYVRKATTRNGFKTALELTRTFPFGVLASQVSPYCYNTGYSSPGTLCSYCES
jgi:hypothetical protein